MNKTTVSIILGSDSDLPIIKEAPITLDEFNITWEISIISAHRDPERLKAYIRGFKERGVKIIIAGAGGAAHLPGVIASQTTLPVVGIPIETKALGGVDSLYSIVQMPSGIPVATVAINGAKNAALLAIEILAISDPKLQTQLLSYRKDLAKAVQNKTKKLNQIGIKKYLEIMEKKWLQIK